MNRTPTADYPLTRGDQISVVAVDYTPELAPAGVTVEAIECDGIPFDLTPEEEEALSQWLADRHFEHDPEEDFEPEDDFNGDY